MNSTALAVSVPVTKAAAVSRRNEILRLIGISALLAMVAVFLARLIPNIVLATGEGTGVDGVDAAIEAAVHVTVVVLRVICIAVGGFLVLFGVVKAMIAHAQDSGPEQNKALGQAGAGLGLVILGSVILNTLEPSFVQIISSSTSVTGP